MDQLLEQPIPTEQEMMARLAEIYHFHGARFLAGFELPIVGSAYWLWMVNLLIREHLAVNPLLKEVCGYGNEDHQ